MIRNIARNLCFKTSELCLFFFPLTLALSMPTWLSCHVTSPTNDLPGESQDVVVMNILRVAVFILIENQLPSGSSCLYLYPRGLNVWKMYFLQRMSSDLFTTVILYYNVWLCICVSISCKKILVFSWRIYFTASLF